eukprot:1469278-Amphidinium_carterae.1
MFFLEEVLLSECCLPQLGGTFGVLVVQVEPDFDIEVACSRSLPLATEKTMGMLVQFMQQPWLGTTALWYLATMLG